MTPEDMADRARALTEKGERLLATFKPPPSNYIGFEGWVDTDLFAEWRSQSLTFLSNALGANHTYTKEFDSKVVEAVPSSNRNGLGILRAVQEDLSGGYLARVRQLVVAEVFDSFLEMAEHLTQEGFVVPAASLAGAVLEDALRRSAQARRLKATSSLESLNNVLADAEVYTRTSQRQVKHWIGVRNDADHGAFDQVDADAVRGMLRDLPGFLDRLQSP